MISSSLRPGEKPAKPGGVGTPAGIRGQGSEAPITWVTGKRVAKIGRA